MENTTQIQNNDFKRFAIPVKMGLLIAIIKIVLSTVQYQFFLGSWGMNMLVMIISLAVGFILLGVTGTMQRKAMGGYINIKDAFQCIFVSILIFVTLNFIYDYVYMQYIDPNMMEKIKESSMGFAEKMGAPQETLDGMEKQFDEQSADKMSIGKQFVGFLSQIVMYSIAGLIIAAIVKKNKPEHLA